MGLKNVVFKLKWERREHVADEERREHVADEGKTSILSRLRR